MSDWIMCIQRLWTAEHVTPLRWHIKSRVGTDRFNEEPWVDTVSFEMIDVHRMHKIYLFGYRNISSDYFAVCACAHTANWSDELLQKKMFSYI